MCTAVVIDASVFGIVLDTSRSAELRSWIERGNGIALYSAEGGYSHELGKSRRMLALMREYRRANRARLVASDSLKVAEESLRVVRTRSKAKDKPILALAMAGEALVLCSEDNKLKRDFVDTRLLPTVGGRRRSVYPVEKPLPEQRRFLERHLCTKRRCP